MSIEPTPPLNHIFNVLHGLPSAKDSVVGLAVFVGARALVQAAGRLNPKALGLSSRLSKATATLFSISAEPTSEAPILVKMPPKPELRNNRDALGESIHRYIGELVQALTNAKCTQEQISATNWHGEHHLSFYSYASSVTFETGVYPEAGSEVPAEKAVHALRCAIYQYLIRRSLAHNYPNNNSEFNSFLSAIDTAPWNSGYLPKAEGGTKLLDFLQALPSTNPSEDNLEDKIMPSPEERINLKVLGAFLKDRAHFTAAFPREADLSLNQSQNSQVGEKEAASTASVFAR